MSNHLALVIFEAGMTRVVGEFYRDNERSKYRFSEAVVELKSKDALGGDRWENCDSMRSDSLNRESKLSCAVWIAWVHLAELALKAHYESLVVRPTNASIDPTPGGSPATGG